MRRVNWIKSKALALALVGLTVMLGYILFSIMLTPRQQQTQVVAQSGVATNTPVPQNTPTHVLTPLIVPTIFIPTRPAVTPPSVLPTIITPTIWFTNVQNIPPPIDVERLPVVLDGPFKGWRIYENRDHGLRIKVPPTFTIWLGQGFPDRDYLFHAGFFDAKYKASDFPPAVGLTVISNAKRSSLDAYFAEYSKLEASGAERYPAPSDIREAQVAGVRSLRFVYYAAGIKAVAVLVPLEDRSKIIEMSHVFDSSIEATFELMVQTFEALP